MAVSSIVVVVGAVLFSSVRRIRRPEHSWEGVRAFNPSLEFFGALPLIIFSFVVSKPGRRCCGSGPWCQLAAGLGRAAPVPRLAPAPPIESRTPLRSATTT